jgi:hypothetical protein
MASIIKADNIQKVSDGSNIIKKCGSTITLGSCGATIALACWCYVKQDLVVQDSASDWCTTAKTSSFYWSCQEKGILLTLLAVQ